MNIEFNGHNYSLLDELTGADFLELRRNTKIGPDGLVDMVSYGHENLIRRLVSWDRPEELPIEKEAKRLTLEALPQNVYQVLYQTAFRAENAEIKPANDFLLGSLNNSQRVELSSILGSLQSPPQSGQEQPSDSEQSD